MICRQPMKCEDSRLERMKREMPCDLQSFAAAIRWTGEDAAIILGLRR